MPVIPRALSLVTLGCLICSGQISFDPAPRPGMEQVDPQKKHEVRGAVVNSVTGAGIPHALVQLQGKSVFSGDDGSFAFTDVPEGYISISAQKPGYFDDRMRGGGPFVAQRPQILKEDLSGFQVKLIPEARIEGRVLDADGSPIRGMQVQAMREQIMNGRKRWQMVGSTISYDTGAFKLENLLPGEYVLHTSLHPVYQTWNIERLSSEPLPVYAPEFYPNAGDLASAQRIEVKGGEDKEIDFSLKAEPGYRVRGAIAGAQNGVWANLEGGVGRAQMQTFLNYDQRTGQFTIPLLPTGSWTVDFHSGRGADRGMFAQQTIAVNGSNVDGVQVVLHAVPVVHLSLQAEGDQPRQVSVTLTPNDAGDERSYGGMAMKGNSDFPGQNQIQGQTPPGTYRVEVQPFGACIASITSGSTDLAHHDFVISEGMESSTIQITLADDCATLNGTVHTESGGDPSGVILLVSDSLPLQPMTYPIQQNGQFNIPNLSPGDYRVYALSDLNNLEYANPDAMRDIQAEHVTLAAKQTGTVNLDLVMRKE